MPRYLSRLIVFFALVVAAPVRAEGVSVEEASAKQNDAMERKLSEGKKLLTKGKFEEALVKLREAHAIVASPKASLMIARAYRDTGELVKAHAECSRAIEEARAAVKAEPKYEETLTEAQKELENLDGVVGKLVIKLIHAPAGTEVTVDGEPIDAAKLSSPLLIAPGEVAVVATAPDGQVARRQASVMAGQSAKVELPFARDAEPATFFAAEPGDSAEPAPEKKQAKSDTQGGIPPLVVVAGGVGIAGIATFAIAGSLSSSKYDELEKSCPNGQCSPHRQDDIDDGKKLQTIANVGLAVGVAGLATGTALLLFGGSKDDGSKKASKTEVGVGYRSVHVRGTFW